MATSIAALIIGNEILSGKVRDRNGPFLASELRQLGAELEAVMMVQDREEAIVEGIRLLAPRVTGLITSGGLGPTHDDVTMQAVARALGRKLQRHPDLERLIRELIDPQGRESNLRMADVPEGTELLWGEGLRIPVFLVDNVYVLPGPPRLFQRKFRAVRDRFHGEAWHLCELLLSCYETEFSECLREVARRHPDVEVGSYPRPGEEPWAVKLTFEGRRRERAEAAREAMRTRLPPDCVITREA